MGKEAEMQKLATLARKEMEASQETVTRVEKLFQAQSGEGWDGSNGEFDPKKAKADLDGAEKKEQAAESKLNAAEQAQSDADDEARKEAHNAATVVRRTSELANKRKNAAKEKQEKFTEQTKQMAMLAEVKAISPEQRQATEKAEADKAAAAATVTNT